MQRLGPCSARQYPRQPCAVGRPSDGKFSGAVLVCQRPQYRDPCLSAQQESDHMPQMSTLATSYLHPEDQSKEALAASFFSRKVRPARLKGAFPCQEALSSINETIFALDGLGKMTRGAVSSAHDHSCGERSAYLSDFVTVGPRSTFRPKGTELADIAKRAHVVTWPSICRLLRSTMQ